MNVNLLQGDCLIKLKELEDNSVDSIVTDPPYELGFMGKKWDSTGIAYNVDMWAECLRVLKPGGHLLSFSGTRTYHRMAVAIEDAGFEVRDMIEWVYASGFPKSLNVFKALTKKCSCGNMEVYENRIKQKGASSKQETEYFLRFMQQADLSETVSFEKERGEVLQSCLPKQSPHGAMQGGEPKESSQGGEERILERRHNPEKTEGELQRSDISEMSRGIFGDGEEGRIHNATQVSNGSTPQEATNKDGSSSPHRPQPEQQQYREPCAFCKQWGTQAIRSHGVGTNLKPAHEPICMARKPLAEKTVAKNCLEWGTGGINVDISRVDFAENEPDKRIGTDTLANGQSAGNVRVGADPKGKNIKMYKEGRFPANLIHDNSEEVRGCFPETKSGGGDRNGKQKGEFLNGVGDTGTERPFEANSGNASRFFKSIPQGRFPANLIHDNSDEVRGCFPETKSVKGKPRQVKNIGSFGGGTTNGDNEYNDSGNASRFFKSIIYQAKASKSERNKNCEDLYILKDGTPEDIKKEIETLLDNKSF